MSRKRPLAERVMEGIQDIVILLKDPYGTEADKVCEETVARYNARVYEFIVEADLVLHPRWPRWHRLLQVRFINLACLGSANIRRAIENFTTKKEPIDVLMREAVRESLLELIEWGKQKKLGKRTPRPKRVDEQWHAAFEEINEEAKTLNRDGKTIDDRSREELAIFGVDYDL